MGFEKTWRWFGKSDNISLSQIRQIGIEGIVTALHHIPNGEVWGIDDIRSIQEEVESHGMRWSVVESLPVHECIKFGGKRRDELIDNYKLSLEHLGKCGVNVVCYNFMPVIDWIRTKLDHKLEDGSEVLYFNFVDFAIFDLFILEREAAFQDYSEEIIQEARTRFDTLPEAKRTELIDTIIIKTQGFIDGISAENPGQAISVFRKRLASYDGIGKNQLGENLIYFLRAIMPVAEKYNMKMCIHPDDPPMSVLGLPRVVSSKEDLEWIFNEVPSASNGLTFCSGSLGTGEHNDLLEIIDACSSRIHFVHLRNVKKKENGDFFETGHLEGGGDLYHVIQKLLIETKQRKNRGRLPMRIDHGAKILFDHNMVYNPGYPLLGRMKAMAEISGLTKGIEQNIEEHKETR